MVIWRLRVRHGESLSRAEAENLVRHLLAAMDALVATVEQETTLVRAGKLTEAVALETTKSELARVYVADTAQVKANLPVLSTQVPQLLDVMTGMQKVANRIFSGLVVGALIVASAMLMPYRRSLSTGGFILSGILGLWMVLTILWSDRRDEKKKKS